jgi:hypothetical protein
VRQKAFIIFFILNTACISQPSTYEYADGNANLYLISSGELKYLPVQAEESSSGTYDGGKAKTKMLSPSQFRMLSDLFEKTLDAQSIHIEKRVMLSGMISVIGSKKRQCILKPGSAEMISIENSLKQILNQ